MKKTKLSKRTIALIAAAVILFAGGGYTGTKAALSIMSNNVQLAFETDGQNVIVLNNKGQINANNPLFDAENLTPGKAEPVGLKIRNTSNADQYVRVIVRKYWKDADGDKITSYELKDGHVAELDMISLGLGSSKWKINNAETTPERTVYYYNSAIPAGAESEDLIKDVTVSTDVLKTKTEQGDNGVITYTYVFDGYTLCIEAEAQAVQTHNGKEAIKSVWGVDASTVGIPVTE